MKLSLKILGFVIGLGAGVYIASRLLAGCGGGAAFTVPFTSVPADSNFAPVTHQTYRPPLIGPAKPPAELPKNVRTKDVRRTIGLKLKTGEIINVIEMNDGEIAVRKDSILESITATDFAPPIVAADLRFGLGLSIVPSPSQGEGLRVGLVASFSPLTWYGRLQAPICTADPECIGFGAQIFVYHDIAAGIVRTWNYAGGDGIKVMLQFEF